MTETEQEHAQAIDLTLERINRLEKKVDELSETLIFTMRMVSNYLDKFEEENYDK
jgi:uncharacterized membrane protein